MSTCLSRCAAVRTARRLSIGAAFLLLTASPNVLAQTLNLADVLARAAQADPSVSATAARMEAAEAGVRQAGVRPLDALAFDAENFAGTGTYRPANMAETTLWYERTLERSGKRDSRIDAARSELGVIHQRGRLRTLDLLERVEEAWVDALAAEAAIGVAEEHLRSTQAVEGEVKRRVSAALDPLFAAQRARTDAAQARIARDQAVQAARIARDRLALYWGGAGDFTLDKAEFEAAVNLVGPPAQEAPDLDLLNAERDAASARVRMEDGKGTPDLTLKGAVRHLAQYGDVALVVGASIPIGTRRANRANVERAMAEQTAAEAELAVSRIERDREIAGLVANREATASEIGRIDREVLPGARRSVSLIQDGLRRGGLAFTYLEAANAREVVTQAHQHRIELLRRYHLAGARLDRLTGRYASLLSSAENR
ncbi:TolC family protein [Novosphingobium sp. P6W]|nr:TolC family protein [Novosphingobium sp. P6W]KIS32362.1 metal transporter [Novosphingobium sp. P6W]